MALLQVKLEEEDLSARFEELDEQSCGKLSLEEISRCCFDFFGQSFRGELLDELFTALQPDTERNLEYSEFLVAIMKEKHVLVDANLRSAFEGFSKDEQGSVPASVLRNVLTCGPCEDEAVLGVVLKQMDERGSTLLTHDEFASLVRSAVDDCFSRMVQRGTAS